MRRGFPALRVALLIGALVGMALWGNGWAFWPLLFVAVSAGTALATRPSRPGRGARRDGTAGAVELVVESPGPRPIEVARVLRQHMDIDPSWALRHMRTAPARMGMVGSPAEAEAIAAELRRYGATASYGAPPAGDARD